MTGRLLMIAGALLLLVAIAGAEEVSCGTTATEIGSSATKRASLIIRNDPAATETVFVDTATVAASGASKGNPLQAGDSVTYQDLAVREKVLCIVASGTQAITFSERKR